MNEIAGFQTRTNSIANRVMVVVWRYLSGRSATLVVGKWLFFSHLTHTRTRLPPPLFPPGSSHENIYQQLLTHSAHRLHNYSTQLSLFRHWQTNKHIHSHKTSYEADAISKIFMARKSQLPSYRKSIYLFFFIHCWLPNHYFHSWVSFKIL